MADYCTLQQAKDMLAGQWSTSDQATGSGSTVSQILQRLVTTCSRLFDRETGKSTNFWAAGTGVTRRYSGDGTVWLDIDDYQTVTAVTMSSNQTRTDAVTLTVSDATSANYVDVYPLQGPPFNRLFLLRGWLPDAYNVGNIAVTGDVVTPEEITHAVAEWAAYMFKAREAGWADAANRPDGPGVLYVKGIPPDTKRIIEYYKQEQRGPGIAVIDSGNSERVSKWLGWRTL
jgi:hypothetical protein